MKESRINVTKPSMPAFEEYIEELRSVWESGWITNYGKASEKYAGMLRDCLGVQNVYLLANGHLGLEVALNCLKLATEKDEIITTPYTHCSTIHAIVRTGFRPVFCDVKESDRTINEELIEDLVTERTAAIMPVHVYGLLCNTEAIGRIADRYGLTVIYDAAHAFGVRKNGVSAAAFGDGALFSTHATKVFQTIEGGAFAANHPSLFRPMEWLVNFGYITPDRIEYIGTNARMNEFEAVMGICNLRRFKEDVQKRRALAERYFERLAGVPGIETLQIPADQEWNYAYFPVFFDGFRKSRDAVKAGLEAENIFARKYFWPLPTKMDCYKEKYGSLELPVAEHAAGTVLSLPMYTELTIGEVDRICDAILK